MSMEHPGASSHPEEHGGGHEERDVSFRPVIGGLLGLLALLLASFVLMLLVFKFFAVREAEYGPPANPLAQKFGRDVPPQPQLQTAPLQDLDALRAQEEAILNGYGWVDRKAGVVRIPVQRALELLAQRGVPTRAQPPPGGGE